MDVDRPEEAVLRRLVRKALEEDRARSDATGRTLFEPPRQVTAEIGSLEHGILAGVDAARIAFLEMDPAARFTAFVEDGAELLPGTVVARVSGDAGGVLAAERTALNFLQKLSGVATLTRRYVEELQGTGVQVLDTRKTTPLLRDLEKYAVRVGGGANHRRNLEEMVLVKENHMRAMGGMEAVLKALEARRPEVDVEVEVDSLELLGKVLSKPPDRVMLDNFSPEEVKEAIEMIAERCSQGASRKPEVEVSGGVDLDRVKLYAIPGVDFISVGAITHSAPAVDMSMEVVEVG